MADFSRLIGAAARALGNSNQGRGGSGSGSGSTDWRDMVRKVSDKVTGDDRGDGQQGQQGRYGQQGQQYGAGQGDPRRQVPAAGGARSGGGSSLSAADRQALVKYDYLLQTAPPQQLEQVHRDAFERLTPEQREQVLARLTAESPADRPASSSPADLARSATRGEVARPGLMKRVLGSTGGKVGAGAAAGIGIGALGGLAVAVAGGAALSAVAAPMLGDALANGVDFEQFAGGFEGLDGLAASGEEFVGGLGEQASGLGEQASGLGEQASGLGEQASEFGSNFQIPGLSDFFER
jgi:hypothetical protein